MLWYHIGRKHTSIYRDLWCHEKEHAVETLVKPIFLLADSQLLFWQTPEGRFLDRVRDALSDVMVDGQLKAAYIGASNDDTPAYYEIFVAAMEGIDIHDCRMIPTIPSEEDLAFLDEADILLLAGGDVRRGWRAFKENGLIERIIALYSTGTVLIGVSAGAVQLGLKGWRGDEPTSKEIFDTFRLVPFVIDVHDESSWRRLRQVLLKAGEATRGLGIPAGGGAIFHPDWTLEPIRHPLTEFAVEDGEVKQSLLYAQSGESPETEQPHEQTPD